jgi:DNA-binding transcriptional ArsR family regulator
MRYMGDRLEALVADEIDDCCEEDIDKKRDELRQLRDSVDDSFDTDDVRALSALGDETRYRVVCALVEKGEMCVCEFDPVLDVSESAVSHALSTLRDAGLVEREKRGRWRYYKATEKAEAVLEALEENE